MVKPKDGKTRIRITENGGVHPVFLATVIGGGALGVGLFLAAMNDGAPFLETAVVFGATWVALLVGARGLFRAFIKRRVPVGPAGSPLEPRRGYGTPFGRNVQRIR